jgi:putative restriction endonuclease
MQQQIPLIYFYQVVKGKYLAVWPVFIVGDKPEELTFTVQVDDSNQLSELQNSSGMEVREEVDAARRSYITSSVRQRVHQRAFRERVLLAYKEQCAMCRLRHAELLDAAHIIPDGEQDGEPVVPNGLSLCKIHHAAFDRGFMGITPDYAIDVRRDILSENDGPMLLHGIKELHGERIILPKGRGDIPKPELLERRYERFVSQNAYGL